MKKFAIHALLGSLMVAGLFFSCEKRGCEMDKKTRCQCRTCMPRCRMKCKARCPTQCKMKEVPCKPCGHY